MGAERTSSSTPLDILAMVLAAIGELEAEKLVSKRGARTPNTADVLARLEQAGVPLTRHEVVETLRVAITDLGLATGVLAAGEDGQPDARSLHVTMQGVRWLRNEVGLDRSAPASSANPAKQQIV